MCGILGGINTAICPNDREKMLQSIAHRGPDDQGFFEHKNIWLAHVRLSIQDLSYRGHQPMQSNDGRYTIVYNGELYNHQDLRKELSNSGIHFRSETDTETLLYAFIQYGPECLDKLQGIFAFAIHDLQDDSVFIARDPLGVKPLYYYQDPDMLLFASELKALSHIDGLDYSIDTASLAAYIRYLYQPGASTPFQKIRKLLPGHYLYHKTGQPVQPVRYYQVPFTGQYNQAFSQEDWIGQVEKKLVTAVKSQLIADVPVGFFLSGGLDSSLIAAIAAKEPADRPLTCFTINTGNGLKQEGFENDIQYARLAARHLKAELIEVEGQLNIAADLDQMIWHLDEPQADPAALYVQHIAKAAQARNIKVLLSGAGADDVFSGYRRHQAIRYEKWLSCCPPALQRTAISGLKKAGMNNTARRLSKLIPPDGNLLHQRIGHHFWLSTDRVNRLFHTPDILTQPYQHFEDLLQEIPDEQQALNQMLYWEMRTFLPDHNLNYTDKMSMAAGVETRVPYLDTDLVALSTQIPPSYKMSGTQTKYILRKVAAKYLPEAIIYRPKTGFGAPLRQWIKGDLAGFVNERLLSGSLEKWGIFNISAIEELIQDNATGKTDAAYSIFALLSIESWLRQFAAKQ